MDQKIVENAEMENSSDVELSDENEAGKFVRRPLSSSDEDESSDFEIRYQSLLAKYNNEKAKNKDIIQSRRSATEKTVNQKPLSDRIRGWQILELEKIADHKEQYHSWLAFKSTIEANWEMYEIYEDREKLICLQTKCKGFVVELINSIHRVKPNFQDIWSGLDNQFHAPIDSGLETLNFYQMKQFHNENIFNFFERVSKQALLCNFAESEFSKHIGEICVRNCLNPSYFLAFFDKFDDMDKIKHHARNFHSAMPKINPEPVLAIKREDFRTSNSGNKRHFRGNNSALFYKKQRLEHNNINVSRNAAPCNYCGESYCNRRRCPARGKICNYCQRLNHFEKACFRKNKDSENEKDAINSINEQEMKVNPDDIIENN